MTNTQIFLNLVTAALAFTGAIGGVVIGQHLQAKVRKQEFDLNFRKEILKHRIALIERFAIGIGKLRRANVIQNMIEIAGIHLNTEVMHLAMKENGGKLPDDYLEKGKPDFQHLLSLNQEQLDIHGEIMAISNLGKVYFGRKTHAAIDKLSLFKPIHTADEESLRDVLNAMAAELNEYP